MSDVGSAVGTLALPLVAVLTLHASTFAVSLLTALGAATAAALALPLGLFVEYRRKRPVMIGTDLARALSLASIPAVAAFDALTYPQLALVAMLNTALAITFGGASQAHLKALVPHAALADANGRLESTQWFASSTGPALGGALVGLLGPARTLLVDAASFLVSAVFVRRIRRPEPPVQTRPASRRGEMAAGMMFLLRNKELRRCLASYTVFASTIMLLSPLQALLLVRELQATPLEYGIVVGLPCLAGLVGARLARRAIDRYGLIPTLWWSSVLRGPWMVLMPLAPTGGIGLLMVGVALAGLLGFAAVANTSLATYRQHHTPDNLMARAATAWSMTIRVGQPLGAVAGGITGTILGVTGGIWFGVVLLVGSAFLLPRRATTTPQSTTEKLG